jgi:NAD(P)-dependent dehydrogenase (short-subunit alcohol dehydrogenase family)
MVSRTVDGLGRLDILVNNARAIIGRDRVPVTDLSREVWDHFMSINATAVFLCTKSAGREMVRLGNGGRIINIASNAAKQASALGAAYSASKFAVIGLTQASALDLAPHGITVNAVCPGSINSGRLSYWERSSAEEEGVTLDTFRAGILEAAGKAIPLGRVAESEDVANMVAFLSSEDAGYITGQAYNVNGGLLFH